MHLEDSILFEPSLHTSHGVPSKITPFKAFASREHTNITLTAGSTHRSTIRGTTMTPFYDATRNMTELPSARDSLQSGFNQSLQKHQRKS